MSDPTTTIEMVPAAAPPPKKKSHKKGAGSKLMRPHVKPQDEVAWMIRDSTRSGAELVEFALACLRDELTGRLAVKTGFVQKLESRAIDLHMAGDKEGAKNLRAQIRQIKAAAAARQAIPVAQNTRLAALQWLSDRLWGKAPETVKLTGADGGPVQVEASSPLADLPMSALADIQAFIEAEKRKIETPAAAPALPASQAVIRLVPEFTPAADPAP